MSMYAVNLRVIAKTPQWALEPSECAALFNAATEIERLEAINAQLVEALSNIVQNADIQPDARMAGLTDCYAVPLDDIDAARAALEAAKEA